MRKHFAIAAVGLGLLATSVRATVTVPEGWHDSVPAARQAALESGNLILVDLYAEWCGWCRRLEKDVFTHPEFAAYAKKFVKLKVDVEDGGDGTALQSRYHASSLPTTLVLTPKMVLVDMLQGYAPREDFVRRLEQGVATFEAEQRTFEELLASDDPDTLLAVARKLHERGDGSRAAGAYRRVLDGSTLAASERTRLLYLLADSQRLDGDFDGAYRSLQESRKRAERAGDRQQLEACDLLRIRIAEDRGLCAATLAALETFLENYPRSNFRRDAKRSLARLNRDECT
jgi:thioredoxin-like negative regulator of GroEL